MNQGYTFIDSNMGGQTPVFPEQGMQGLPQGMQQGMTPLPQGMQQGMPQQNFDALRQYISHPSMDDSDSDSDSEDESSSGRTPWHHYYGVANLILLLIILFFIWKIKKELSTMYE